MLITTTLIAAIGVIYLGFGINVGIVRARTQTLLGPGDDPRLMRAIRAHGNLAEWAPIAILLIAALENSAAPTTMVTGLASAYAAARLLHGIGLINEYGKPHPLRAIGAFTNVIVVAWGSVYLLWHLWL
ncbi:MAG: MAPEG family protein [Kordiimonadaceae bacterium]|nr:MAPEG family protein [Kordiimonadaceae bacterium]MBO6569733.1 MAPEG family protein [Kordiimonadaceae bacterium]MBO6966268.1 MAPEG family protein [Kordiimonadaceae bacterium]